VSQNYHLYDPARRTFAEARNVTFLEDLPEILNKVKFQRNEGVKNTNVVNEVLNDTDNSAKGENHGNIESAFNSSTHKNSESMNMSDEKVVLEFSTPKRKVATEVNYIEPTKKKLSQLYKLRDRLHIKSPDRYSSYNTREI